MIARTPRSRPYHRPCFIVAATLLAASVGSRLSSKEPAPALHEIDRQRAELLVKIEAHRVGANHNDLSHRARLWVEYYLLDYDDPRTRLGAALAMQNGRDMVIEIIFDMVLHRPPDDQAVEMCHKHMETKSDTPKEAIEDIIWALCNTKEFVDRIR